MHRKGHIGVALLAYAPLGFLAAAMGASGLATIGAVAAAGLSMIPDYDVRLPLIKHRGITHTVWFALVFGIVGGGVGGQLADGGLLATGGLMLFGFAVGTVSILSHLVADSLTPMGIQPFTPVGKRRYTLSAFPAADPAANYFLLLMGVLLGAAALFVGGLV